MAQERGTRPVSQQHVGADEVVREPRIVDREIATVCVDERDQGGLPGRGQLIEQLVACPCRPDDMDCVPDCRKRCCGAATLHSGTLTEGEARIVATLWAHV